VTVGIKPLRPFVAFAEYLSKERATILAAWRVAVEQDPELTTASSVSRVQFNDHIPEVLDAFERQLRASDADAREEAVAQEQESAAEHGLHRWQQGYDQRETMREWGHLQLCLLDAIERFGQSRADLDSQFLHQTRGAVVRLCNDGVCESASRYTRLLRAEATSRLHELEQALEQVRLMERQRAETWREAAHDLRGSVSVISSAVAVLNRDPASTGVRPESRLLRKGVISLHEMLTDLLSLARLEAGHERRQLALVDVGELMKEFCDAMRPLAAERNLFLRSEGPASLTVESDSAKIRRIAQNLVLNALRATDSGGVTVSWARGEPGTPARWVLVIEDTGPGFAGESAPLLARALEKATESADRVEHSESEPLQPSAVAQNEPGVRSGFSRETPREGIGLSIVKRLCELLDASIELHSSPQGSVFRLTFPATYPA